MRTLAFTLFVLTAIFAAANVGRWQRLCQVPNLGYDACVTALAGLRSDVDPVRWP